MFTPALHSTRVNASDLLARGYHPVYHLDEINHCPGCGRVQWYIGRMTAECAFCATALPLQDISTRSSSGSRHY